jgi:hypothetical protein
MFWLVEQIVACLGVVFVLYLRCLFYVVKHLRSANSVFPPARRRSDYARNCPRLGEKETASSHSFSADKQIPQVSWDESSTLLAWERHDVACGAYWTTARGASPREFDQPTRRNSPLYWLREPNDAVVLMYCPERLQRKTDLFWTK